MVNNSSFSSILPDRYDHRESIISKAIHSTGFLSDCIQLYSIKKLLRKLFQLNCSLKFPPTLKETHVYTNRYASECIALDIEPFTLLKLRHRVRSGFSWFATGLWLEYLADQLSVSHLLVICLGECARPAVPNEVR